MADWLSLEKDYYAILGVSPKADRKTISNAYRSKIKAIHPDSHQSVPDPSAGKHIAELVEAWRILGDDDKRAEYDFRRAVRPPRPNARPETPAAPPKAAPKPPVLEVVPAALDFGTLSPGEVATRRLRIENRGGAAATLERGGNLPEWVAVRFPENPRKGEALHFPLELTVRVDGSHLSNRTRHRAEFTLRLAGTADGLRSAEVVVPISVAVGAEEVPRPAVSPGTWLIERAECLGAPRSLLLHLFVGNGGGGALSGSVKSSPWIRVPSRSFGPIENDSPPLHMVVEVDCAAWKDAGWSDGRVAVVTSQGDVREAVAIVSHRSLGGGRLGRLETLWLNWFPVYLLLVAAAPWLALLGVLPYQSVWFAVAAALVQPMLLEPLRRMEMVARGPRGQADGWSLGAPLGGTRFWASAACWASVSGLLGISVGRSVVPSLDVASSGAVAAMAGAIAGLSFASRSGPLVRVERGSGLLLSLLDGAGWVVIGVAWSVLGALVSQAMLGGMVRGASLWGGCFGWTAGCLLAIARNGAVPQPWRRRSEEIACAGVPLALAALGFAASLGLALDLLPAGASGASAAGYAHGRPSALLALPGASLASAMVAAASCLGLLGGYGLGLVSLLPAMSIPRLPGAVSRSPRVVARWCGELLLEMALDHAALNANGGEVQVRSGRLSATEILAQLHWTTAAVVGIALLLALYAAGNLLLALFAAVGIAIG